MATPSLILVPSKYKIGTLYTEVATTSAGTVLGSLGDFSVTRASVATRVNSQGFIETIPAVTNLVLRSEEFNDASWTKTNATVSSNTATAPNGTLTADTLTATGTNGQIQQVIVGVSGTTYVASFYIKRRTGTGVVNIRAVENIDTPITITNEWARVSFAATATTTTVRIGIRLSTSGDAVDVWGAQLEVGTVPSNYVQTVAGVVTNSIPRIDYYTGSGTVGCPALLVEPSAQNLALNSNNTATNWILGANLTSGYVDVIGVSGNTLSVITSGSSLNAGAGRLIRGSSVSIVSGTTYTFSFFMKKTGTHTIGAYRMPFANGDIGSGFDVSGSFSSDSLYNTGVTSRTRRIEQWGTDVYRCIETFTATASGVVSFIGFAPVSATNSPNNPAVGAGIAFAAPQLEVGSVPTSFIPTTTGTVTRNADVINLSGAVSGCISQTEGTFYAEVDVRNLGIETYFLRIDDGGATNIITLRKLNTNQIREAITAPTTSGTVNISSSTFTSGILKIAVAYKSGDISLCVNGTNFTANGTFSFSAPFSRISIGSNVTLGSELNDRIRSVALYTTRLPNEELELLTYPTYYSNVRDLIWGTFAARTSSFSELQSCLQTRHNQLIIV
jgi:hypothetical protein